MEEKHCLEAKIVAQRKEAEKREKILIDHFKEISKDLNQLEAKSTNKKEELKNKSSS
jgi:hypothetical protein